MTSTNSVSQAAALSAVGGDEIPAQGQMFLNFNI